MRGCLVIVLLFLSACDTDPEPILPLRTPVAIQTDPVVVPAKPPLVLKSVRPEEPPGPLEQESSIQYDRRPPRLSAAEIESLGRDLMELRHSTYRFDVGGRCGWRDAWLVESMKEADLEGWHFADLYPDQARRIALEVFRDEEAYIRDRDFALHLLIPREQPLPPELEGEVIRLVDHEESWLADWAIWVLAANSPPGRHAALFRNLCSRGREPAFEVLSWSVDPETRAFFENLERAGKPDSACLQWVPFRAAENLKRMDILESPLWKSRIEISLMLDDSVLRHEWAEQIAYKRLPDRMLAQLQRRIDIVRGKLKNTIQPDNVAQWERNPRFFAEHWRLGDIIPESGPDYDRILVEFAGLGGRLNVWEARRLAHFGFLGDREARLQEILRPGFRW